MTIQSHTHTHREAAVPVAPTDLTSTVTTDGLSRETDWHQAGSLYKHTRVFITVNLKGILLVVTLIGLLGQ